MPFSKWIARARTELSVEVMSMGMRKLPSSMLEEAVDLLDEATDSL